MPDNLAAPGFLDAVLAESPSFKFGPFSLRTYTLEHSRLLIVDTPKSRIVLAADRLNKITPHFHRKPQGR